MTSYLSYLYCILIALASPLLAMSTAVTPGMTQYQFEQHLPGAMRKTSDTLWQRPATVQGLPGKWSYHFRDDLLSEYVFEAHSRELTAKRFAQWRSGANAIIAQLTRDMGPPTTITKGDQHFRDPAKDHHWGYDVVDAYWNRIKYGVRVKFTFFGGKGDYFFVTSQEVAPTAEWKNELAKIRASVQHHIETTSNIGKIRVGYIKETDHYALAEVHALDTVTDPATVWLRRSKGGDWVVIAGPTTALDTKRAGTLGIPKDLLY